MSRRKQIDNNSINELGNIAEEYDLKGGLDECDANGIRGWIINESISNNPAEIDIIIDGVSIIQTTANLFRQDLLDAGIENGKCAFHIPMPANFFDNIEHEIEIREVVSRQLLNASPRSFIIPIKKLRGNFEVCDMTGLRGWIIDENKPDEPVKIDVFVDDTFIKQCTANIFRQDLQDEGISNGECAFDICIPSHLFDDRQHKFEIKESASQSLLDGSPKSCFIPVKKLRGNVDACDAISLRGWVIDDNSPDSVEVDIFVDNELITQVTANIFRQDLLDAGIGDGKCGFNGVIPDYLFDNLEHQIDIKEKLTGWSLANFKTTLQRNCGKITWDGFFDKYIEGWVIYEKNGNQKINLTIANQYISSFVAKHPRPEVQAVLNLDSDKLGFHQDIGSILQFLALSKSLLPLKLSLDVDSLISLDVDVKVEDAITFAPMNLILKQRDDLFSLFISRIEIVGEDILGVTFQRRARDFHTENYNISMYQIDNNGILKLISFQSIDGKANLARMSGKTYDIQKPILMVVVNKIDNLLICADCIPYPAMFHQDNELMIELHSLFVNGLPPLEVNRQLQKHWLDSEIRLANPNIFANSINSNAPDRSKTAVVFYSRDIDTISDILLLPNWTHLAKNAYLMESQLGKFKLKYVPSNSLDFDDIEVSACESIENAACESIDSFSLISEPYLLFWDISATIRPDYWSVVYSYCPSIKNYKIISGNTIIYDGLSIPYYVGHKPITDFSETIMDLLPLSSALIQKDIVVNLSNITEKFTNLFPENIIAQAAKNDLFHLRIPVDVRREPPLLKGEKYIYSNQNNLNSNLLEPFNRASIIENPMQSSSIDEGFSVIINFRNAVETTKKAITSLRMQDYKGNIELILINNGSHISSVNAIKSHAELLFDKEFVKLIDHPFSLNHSTQIDLGVEAARYPLLLMLSNDTYLLSLHCLTRASTLLKNPQVGTCGFRIIEQINDNEFNVESLGLKLALSKLSTLGGHLLSPNVPLDRDVNHVIRVGGNTFTATAMRTDVFKKARGINKELSVTYSDVEMCLKISNYGLIHIADGLSIVQHADKGVNSPCLECPVEPALLKNVQNVDDLANGYVLYDFGGLRVF